MNDFLIHWNSYPVIVWLDMAGIPWEGLLLGLALCTLAVACAWRDSRHLALAARERICPGQTWSRFFELNSTRVRSALYSRRGLSSLFSFFLCLLLTMLMVAVTATLALGGFPLIFLPIALLRILMMIALSSLVIGLLALLNDAALEPARVLSDWSHEPQFQNACLLAGPILDARNEARQIERSTLNPNDKSNNEQGGRGGRL